MSSLVNIWILSLALCEPNSQLADVILSNSLKRSLAVREEVPFPKR